MSVIKARSRVNQKRDCRHARCAGNIKNLCRRAPTNDGKAHADDVTAIVSPSIGAKPLMPNRRLRSLAGFRRCMVPIGAQKARCAVGARLAFAQWVRRTYSASLHRFAPFHIQDISSLSRHPSPFQSLHHLFDDSVSSTLMTVSKGASPSWKVCNLFSGWLSFRIMLHARAGLVLGYPSRSPSPTG